MYYRYRLCNLEFDTSNLILNRRILWNKVRTNLIVVQCLGKSGGTFRMSRLPLRIHAHIGGIWAFASSKQDARLIYMQRRCACIHSLLFSPNMAQGSAVLIK